MQNNEGNTPLHVACAAKRFGVVKLLLRAGERPHSVHIPNAKGRLPIDYVAKATDPGSRQIHAYLLGKAGALAPAPAAASHRGTLARASALPSDYEIKLREVYSLSDDIDVLRKYILDLTMDVTEFRERCKVRV